MNLVPWRRSQVPEIFDQFRREMDELVRSFFGGGLEATRGTALQAWAPRVDVEETEKEIVVKADLPGVDPKDIEIIAHEGVLIVKGQKKEEREEKGKQYHRVERFEGQFYREIPRPAAADADKITAKSANGVVTVTIPKKPEAQAKKITVLAGK
jgi:HSP20 family protein